VQRNDLYGRVQEVLDLAAYYAPGELGEFPERVAKTVSDFKNYRNLADKQIQERDNELETLRTQLAAALRERDAAHLRILNLRIALREIVNQSVGGESLETALDALAHDDKSHAKALAVSEPATPTEGS